MEAASDPIDAKFMYDWTISYIQEHDRLPEFPMWGLLYQYLLERNEVKALPNEKPQGRFALMQEDNRYEQTVTRWFKSQGIA